MYNTNLSWRTLNRFLSSLLKEGMIEKKTASAEKNVLYAITEKGKKYLDETQQLELLPYNYIKAKTALRESEEQFRSLAENSPNMIFVYHKGSILYVNTKCEEIMGYGRKEFYSKKFNLASIISPEFRDIVMANITKYEKGECVDGNSREIGLITKKGRKIDAIITTSLAKHNEGNAIIGVATDITKRKKMEMELRFAEEKNRAVFNSFPWAIKVYDLKGTITDCNKLTSTMHEYSSKDELIGKSVFELIAEKDRKRAEENMRKTFNEGSIKNVEYTLLTQNGREFQAKFSASVIRDSSNIVIGFVAVTEPL